MNHKFSFLATAAMMSLLPLWADNSADPADWPQYVLEATQETNGYQIDAHVIKSLVNAEQADLVANYHWGVKYPDSPIVWSTSQEPSLFVPGQGKAPTVYFKVSDLQGQSSPVQFINVKAQPLFQVTNSALSIDSDKNLYKPNGSEYTYKYGIIYLIRNTNLPSEYQTAIWTPTKAKVFSPFGANYTIPVDGGELSVKDVIPETELTDIFQHSVSGQSQVYLVALQNPENKVMQVVPVTMTLK